jgi:hypothetical protein
MSRQAELTPAGWWLDALELEAKGYKRCVSCGQLLPLSVSRCRRRQCPSYSPTWARDTMRKIRENLTEYGGLVVMVTLTAPGQEVGLVWDKSLCRHPAGEPCSGRKGCRVLADVAALWNENARKEWSELNRICKQRAGRVLRRLGYSGKGGLGAGC